MVNKLILIREHKEIENIINDIRALLNAAAMEQTSDKLAQMICTLAGLFKIHLETEYKYFYPVLNEDPDEKVREAASKYKNELIGISAMITDYKNRYNTKSKIMNSIEGFINESEEVLTALAKRIAMEDAELYTLLS